MCSKQKIKALTKQTNKKIIPPIEPSIGGERTALRMTPRHSGYLRKQVWFIHVWILAVSVRIHITLPASSPLSEKNAFECTTQTSAFQV